MMAWGRKPMLPHVMRHGSDDSGTGVCTSHCGLLAFKQVRRPVHPLDLP